MKKVCIFVRLSGMPGRNELNGVFRYLAQADDWNIRIPQDEVELANELRLGMSVKSGTDGFIIASPVSEEIYRLIESTSVPTVLLDIHPYHIRRRKARLAFIQNDDAGIGQIGARHLASLGSFRSFAFIHSKKRTPWSSTRAEAFINELARMRRTVRVFPPNQLEPDADRRTLSQFLSALEKPAAVLAAWDGRAFHVLECCHDAHIDVPDELVLLGVDDEPLCEHTKPPLASIRPDNEAEGFRAAEVLDRLMRGHRPPRTAFYPILGVSERESASAIAPGAHLIRNALAFIQNNAARDIRVADVVAHLGVSRRLADARFRQFYKKTILETITHFRIEELKHRLRATDAPIKRITTDCGFKNAQYVKTLFLRHVGMTMRAWRQSIS